MISTIFNFITSTKFFRLITLLGTIISLLLLFQKYSFNKKSKNE